MEEINESVNAVEHSDANHLQSQNLVDIQNIEQVEPVEINETKQDIDDNSKAEVDDVKENDEDQQFDPNDLNREKFDYVVFGSGLTENILGAALAISGQKCLFLDQADRYGGNILNFNLEHYFNYNLQPKQVLSSNQYPRILYSKSISVSELIRSGVNNYLEFQSVAENFFFANGTFQKIPFSKSEVFSSSLLTFKEKRQLVKVMEACLAGYDKIAQREITKEKINSTHTFEKEIDINLEEQAKILDNKDKPIRSFLESMGIEKKMQDILLYAIGGINENQFVDEQINLEKITTFQFFERIQKYLRSIGYYGDSPFMVCVYGTSEYSQAFSRAGSIHGCIYIVNDELKMSDLEFSDKEESKKGFDRITISYNTNPIIAKKGIIVGPEYQSWIIKQAGVEIKQARKVQASIMRLAIITKKPLMENQHELATYVIPPMTEGFNNPNPVRVFQSNDYTYAVPSKHYLILASMSIKPNPTDEEMNTNKQVFRQFLKQFYDYEWDHSDLNKDIYIVEQVKETPIQENVEGNLDKEEVKPEKTDEVVHEQQQKQEESKTDQQLQESDIIFAVMYVQDYKQDLDDLEKQNFSNTTFIKDTPFDTDIDQAFNEAQSLFYEKLGNKDLKFLQRSDEEEEKYREMHNYDEDDDSDEDKVIADLETNMVSNNATNTPATLNEEPESEKLDQLKQDGEVDTKKVEDQMLDDLLDDLIGDNED
ncbi:UNKNOWN [Stylonychia lemnae]|uniref:Uncharacterized protein n=1 Tax=Stylonychia lemnae TaxID=5949 RepID=A0A078B201_STYLE|nr:UNKNOWN [Stylonychia lemnae]|eukprot:CDW88529.1 UNKNOWN [Stylonychia lemnae]